MMMIAIDFIDIRSLSRDADASWCCCCAPSMPATRATTRPPLRCALRLKPRPVSVCLCPSSLTSHLSHTDFCDSGTYWYLCFLLHRRSRSRQRFEINESEFADGTNNEKRSNTLIHVPQLLPVALCSLDLSSRFDDEQRGR